MKTKFYKCNVCGKQAVAINDTEGELVCCGQPMVEIETKDKEEFFLEKHMPVYYRKKDKVVVRVGSKFHPATKEHHIEWVSLLTNKGLQIKNVEPYEDPEVTFYVDEDEEIKPKKNECIKRFRCRGFRWRIFLWCDRITAIVKKGSNATLVIPKFVTKLLILKENIVFKSKRSMFFMNILLFA